MYPTEAVRQTRAGEDALAIVTARNRASRPCSRHRRRELPQRAGGLRRCGRRPLEAVSGDGLCRGSHDNGGGWSSSVPPYAFESSKRDQLLMVVVAEGVDLSDRDLQGRRDIVLLIEGRVGRVAPCHPGTERLRQLLGTKLGALALLLVVVVRVFERRRAQSGDGLCRGSHDNGGGWSQFTNLEISSARTLDEPPGARHEHPWAWGFLNLHVQNQEETFYYTSHETAAKGTTPFLQNASI